MPLKTKPIQEFHDEGIEVELDIRISDASFFDSATFNKNSKFHFLFEEKLFKIIFNFKNLNVFYSICNRFINTFEFVFGSTFDVNLTLSDFCKFEKKIPDFKLDFTRITNKTLYSCLEINKITTKKVFNYFLSYLDSDKKEGSNNL